MKELPDDSHSSAVNFGGAHARIEQEDVGENGGGEREVESRDLSDGDRLGVESVEDRVGDAPMYNGGVNSPGSFGLFVD